MDLIDKNQLLDYLKQNSLWAKKGLSQNFLVDRNALKKIVKAAELKADDLVIEIGPGVGTLTQELIKNVGEVISVELDKNLAEILAQQFKNYNLEFKINDQFQNFKFENSLKTENCKLKIICDDIMKVNLEEIIGHHKYKVVANIPYHITSKILELFLSRGNKPELMVLLVQKEVAERICAKPGDMSVLSVSVQLYGQPEIIDVVPNESFFPSPKVNSAILKIAGIKHPELSIQQEKEFFRLIHIGFSSRRKTLVNNLSAGYRIIKNEAADIINKAGLSELIRAQELSIEEWKKLASEMGSGNVKR